MKTTHTSHCYLLQGCPSRTWFNADEGGCGGLKGVFERGRGGVMSCPAGVGTGQPRPTSVPFWGRNRGVNLRAACFGLHIAASSPAT